MEAVPKDAFEDILNEVDDNKNHFPKNNHASKLLEKYYPPKNND